MNSNYVRADTNYVVGAQFPAGRTMVAPGTDLVLQFVAKPN